jgi:enoyl-CoA hydratase/carnithine racemase
MTTTSEQHMIIEEHGDVTVLKLNRPEKLNAWSPDLQNACNQFFLSLNSGEYKTRAVVLTGEGRAFCSGADVTRLPSADPEGERAKQPWRPPHWELQTHEIMRRCNVPVIGAINSYAIGLGFGLALATDLRIAADDARFQVTQVKRGLFGDFGIGHLLPQLVGPQRALELMFTGRMIDAQEALDMGIVLKVVARDALLDEAIALGQEIAKSGPLGVAASKRVVYLREDDMWNRSNDFTGLAIERLFQTEDAKEGALSFIERREPRFIGR